jgi:hypothetical protein
MRTGTIARFTWIPIVVGAACASGRHLGSLSGDPGGAGAGGSGGSGGDGAGANGGNGGDGASTSSSAGGGACEYPPPADLGGHFPDPACGGACGDVERCDGRHLGIDDNCDGVVDEGCTCTPGETHFCFRGDPAKRKSPGCWDGVETCTAEGVFGPCEGGSHAADGCSSTAPVCPGIEMAPLLEVDLHRGVGAFGDDAIAEEFQVQCPAGVSRCAQPSVQPPSGSFRPVETGTYEVVYTKQLSGGEQKSCTFPLQVRGRGLRVELDWASAIREPLGSILMLHEPGDTTPWVNTDHTCSRASCRLDASTYVAWFAPRAVPPEPVNWYLDPELANNTCYFFGSDPCDPGIWRHMGRGCRNPRIDLSPTTICSPDRPKTPTNCGGEAIALDFPPRDAWIRVAVDLDALTRATAPTVRIVCGGDVAAVLGPRGYGSPEAEVVLQPTAHSAWLVADVLFPADTCSSCVVRPIGTPESNATVVVDYLTEFGPNYPPIP